MPIRTEIHIRDPFVVANAADGIYTLFGTTDADCWQAQGHGFDAFTSTDLDTWTGPISVFRPTDGFWGKKNFWAPEVHAWRGRHFMFASFKADGVCRGTQILAADNLLGPFAPHTEGAVTPADWECLDGTLFVDSAGHPWIVFCHEWVQVNDGEICAMPLTVDLRRPAGDPVRLFRASQAPWVTPYPREDTFVTDGPFMHRTADGTLLMLWSSFQEGRYAQGVARSESGGILGPWRHEPGPLYVGDGGHGMIFRTLAGALMLALHTPNNTPNERPIFIPIGEDEGRLILQ